MAASSIIYIQYANINLDALRLTGLKHDEYTYCYIIEQYQKISGWAECGAGNNFKSPYALKKYIAERAGIDERKMNRLNIKLRKAGYLEESPDKLKFRITAKFFVLSNPAPKGEAERQASMDDAVTAQEAKVRASKIPFSESAYNNDFEKFKADLSKVKNLPSDTDWQHYYDKIKHYYTVEHPDKMFVDWLHRCRDWLDKDRHKGALRKMSDVRGTMYDPQNPMAGKNIGKSPNAKTFRGEKLGKVGADNDSDLSASIDLFEKKVKEPETDIYNEYRETAETYVALAEKGEIRNLLTDDQKKELGELKIRLKTPGALRPYQDQQLRLLYQSKDRAKPPDDDSS
jgi:hypothetical protein